MISVTVQRIAASVSINLKFHSIYLTVTFSVRINKDNPPCPGDAAYASYFHPNYISRILCSVATKIYDITSPK